MDNNHSSNMGQVALTSERFYFQTGPDLFNNHVSCRIVDVFHKKIFGKTTNDRKARVVSFMYETDNFSNTQNYSSIPVKGYVIFLSQTAVGENWIGGNMHIEKWQGPTPDGLKIMDDFQTTYESSLLSLNLPSNYNEFGDGFTTLNEKYIPLSLLQNRKVIGRRKIGTEIYPSRLISLFRPVVYYAGPNFRNEAGWSLPFYALGYESSQAAQGLSSGLSIITNPDIAENFQ